MDIKNRILILKNNCYARLLKIHPINFSLKSEYEKEQIIDSYKQFLNLCDFDFQIIIKTKKENVNSHVNYILRKNVTSNKLLQEYCNYIENLINSKEIFLKMFYLIYSINGKNFESLIKVEDELNKKYNKIEKYLKNCGNDVDDLSGYTDEEFCNLISTFINERENLYEFY